MKAEITIHVSNYCNVYDDKNDACFIAVVAGITISNYCNVYGDENDACFIAMAAGVTKVITATYTLINLTCFSLQWKRE